MMQLGLSSAVGCLKPAATLTDAVAIEAARTEVCEKDLQSTGNLTTIGATQLQRGHNPRGGLLLLPQFASLLERGS